MTFVPSFSNSQYLDASFNQCTYCNKDSFGSYQVFVNLVLLVTTSTFLDPIFFLISLSLYKLFLLVILGKPKSIISSQLHCLTNKNGFVISLSFPRAF